MILPTAAPLEGEVRDAMGAGTPEGLRRQDARL